MEVNSLLILVELFLWCPPLLDWGTIKQSNPEKEEMMAILEAWGKQDAITLQIIDTRSENSWFQWIESVLL